MPKRSQIDRVVEQLQAEISEREAMIARLIGAQEKAKPRQRKKKTPANVSDIPVAKTA